MFSVPTTLGLPALFGLIFAECVGIPVPGETALITAGVLAGAGHLLLPAVVATAVAAAVLGDTLGYWLGRRGGRAVLLRHGPFKEHREHLLGRSETFFAKHGPKTVFLGRFVPGVRVFAAVTAGASGMPWPRFAVFNITGAIAWATTVAGLAALVGPTASAAFGAAMIATGVGGAIALLWTARKRRRRNGPVGMTPRVPG
jgi:undecaprenyl-diphosphatase